MESTNNDIVIAPPAERLTPKVSWGAIFSGTFVGLAVWFVLYLLGLGIGLTTAEPDVPSSLHGVLMGTTVWGLIAPIIGLFVGGLIVGRMVGPLSRATGAVYGTIVWAVSSVAAILLLWSIASAALGGATRMAAGVASGVASGVGSVGAAAMGAAGDLPITTQDLIVPINQRLRALGKPTIKAENLEAALGQAVRQAVQQGSLDQDILIAALAERTALSREDAEDVASELQRRAAAALGSVGSSTGAVRDRASELALQAVESTGKGLIWMFVSMALALAACIGAATIAVGHERKRASGPVHATPHSPPR